MLRNWGGTSNNSTKRLNATIPSNVGTRQPAGAIAPKSTAQHQADHRRRSKPRCWLFGMRPLTLLLSGCLFLFVSRSLFSARWTRTDPEREGAGNSSSLSETVVDVAPQPIPPRVDEDIPTMGDETCMFHNKIRRIRNVLPDDNNGVGYILIDTSCPSPFFMIRWSGAALIMAKPLRPPLDLNEFIPSYDDVDSRNDSEKAGDEAIDMDTLARSLKSNADKVIREIEARYKIDTKSDVKDTLLHRFFYAYNMSAAPAGRYSLEIVGIRCDLHSDLRALEYDPANNTAMTTNANPANVSEAGGDPVLMESLACVANPACGLSLNQRHLITYNGGTRNLHPETVISSKEDELWVVEPTMTSWDKYLLTASWEKKNDEETHDDDKDGTEDVLTKMTTRYQEPLCFYEGLDQKKPLHCGVWASQGDSWSRYHYRSRLSHRQVLEKMEKATSQGQPLTLCMVGDSHSRILVDADYFLNFFNYVFVRFASELDTIHAWKYGAPGPEIRVVLDDDSVVLSSTRNNNGAAWYCSSEQDFRFPWQEDVIHCTTDLVRVRAAWYRAHFAVPHNRHIKTVIVRDPVVEEEKATESSGQNKTSAWFGGGYDTHGQVIMPSSTIASVHLSMEPHDVMGVHAVWSSSINAAEIVPEAMESDGSPKNLLEYHLHVPTTVGHLPWFNLSLVSVTHSGYQRPSHILPQTPVHESLPFHPFPHDCEYSGVIMGQWMAFDPYTLDRLHDEMTATVRHIRSVAENPKTALRSVWWRSHNMNPLRATSLVCPIRSWHDPSMAWAYNVVFERTVRKEGGSFVHWMDHELAMNPAWDRATDWNHPLVVSLFEALELYNAMADQALRDRNLL